MSQSNQTLEQKIEKKLSETITITKVGKYNDPKPDGKVWLTVGTDLFVLNFSLASKEISELLLECKPEENKNKDDVSYYKLGYNQAIDDYENNIKARLE